MSKKRTKSPISAAISLLLGPSSPGERSEVVARHYIATVSGAAEAANFPGGRINLKVDTGMGRIGCRSGMPWGN
jgi:alanine racemase